MAYGTYSISEEQEDTPLFSFVPVVPLVLCDENATLEIDDKILKLMQTFCDLYMLKKRITYSFAIVDFLKAKTKRQTFKKPELNFAFLDRAFLLAIKYVQKQRFGPALEMLRNNFLHHFDAFLKRLRNLAVNSEQTHKVNKLKMLRNLRPYIELPCFCPWKAASKMPTFPQILKII